MKKVLLIAFLIATFTFASMNVQEVSAYQSYYGFEVGESDFWDLQKNGNWTFNTTDFYSGARSGVCPIWNSPPYYRYEYINQSYANLTFAFRMVEGGWNSTYSNHHFIPAGFYAPNADGYHWYSVCFFNYYQFYTYVWVGSYTHAHGFDWDYVHKNVTIDFQWHLMSLIVQNKSSSCDIDFYYDGSLLATSNALPITANFSIAMMGAYETNFGGSIHIDDSYLTDEPPIPEPEPVFLDVSSTPFNSSIILNNGSSYQCPQIFQFDYGTSVSVTTQSIYNFNETHFYRFSHWVLNSSTTSYSETISLTLTGNSTIVAYYDLDASIYIEGGVFSFGIGLLGLILVFMSWFVAYWQYKKGNYAEAIGYWLVMFIVGAGLCTVLVGG